MSGERSTSGLQGSRLLAAISLIVALCATALIATENAQASPRPGDLTAVAMPPLPTTPAPTPSTTPPVSTTVPTPSASPLPPTAPINLVATSVKTGSVTLAWTPSTPGCCPIESYQISYYRAFNDVMLATVVENVSTTTITNGIAAASQYTFWVSARDVQGNHTGSSNAVTVITPATDTGPDVTPPSAPTDLTLTLLDSTGGVLSWSPSGDDVGVTGYSVYHFDGWYTSTLLATVTGTTYTAPPPPPSSIRTMYYVRARDAAGNVSIASDTVNPANATSTPVTPSASPPASPTCRVTYTSNDQWSTGFVINVQITNLGTVPVSGWTLGFTFGGDQEVTAAWNSTYAQSGTTATLSNASWNRVIAGGDSISVGFLGTWTASNGPATGFTLNGDLCAVG